MTSKVASVEVWGFLMGEDVRVKTLEGNLEAVSEEIFAISPVKDQIGIRKALFEGAWSTETIWIGGHQLGIRVLSIKEIEADVSSDSLIPVTVGRER